ncbi:hypothetical protein [Legionella fallonii]|uniref:Uncharacterized protein n=1 Tax=Legionella fallonii LLAP-10 TaxID=1212491 RepID=A0A098FZB3_9GAMM|nr:hypothetical protein [Legionella fallonii]CEG55568.1 protein of unknown function [Legionella fallonii LLAP-10]
MPKEKGSTESYSYAKAQEKINALKLRGYQFVGHLPEDTAPWGMLKVAFFLFVKDSSYYQYRGKSLLSDPVLALEFDDNNEPVGDGFCKIINENYIYVIFTQKKLEGEGGEKLVVLLKKDAAMTGHSFLIGPYGKLAARIIGGEVYYHNGELLLINRKSGSFHREVDEAVPFIRAIWGVAGEKAFHAAVEKDDVLNELQRRKALSAALRHPAGALSLVSSILIDAANVSAREPSALPTPDAVTLPGMILDTKPMVNPPPVSPAPVLSMAHAPQVTFFKPEVAADDKPTPTCSRCIIL